MVTCKLSRERAEWKLGLRCRTRSTARTRASAAGRCDCHATPCATSRGKTFRVIGSQQSGNGVSFLCHSGTPGAFDDPPALHAHDLLCLLRQFQIIVTMTNAVPASVFKPNNSSSIIALDSSSRLPVGSSAKRSRGWLTKARARATRCCSPPGKLDRIMFRPPAESHALQPVFRLFASARFATEFLRH